MRVSVFVSLALLLSSEVAGAQASAIFAQSKGYIINDRGAKCWFYQASEKGVYFFERLPSDIGTIKFDNPNCMANSGLGLEINKRQINNVISRWYLGTYTHEDANFQTDPSKLFNKSPLQVRGQCMQSQAYPIIGILIDYEVANDSIVGITHGRSAGGCTN